jgi:hypothetical protein
VLDTYPGVGGYDSATNFMNYSDGCCMETFTPDVPPFLTMIDVSLALLSSCASRVGHCPNQGHHDSRLFDVCYESLCALQGDVQTILFKYSSREDIGSMVAHDVDLSRQTV